MKISKHFIVTGKKHPQLQTLEEAIHELNLRVSQDKAHDTYYVYEVVKAKKRLVSYEEAEISNDPLIGDYMPQEDQEEEQEEDRDGREDFRHVEARMERPRQEFEVAAPLPRLGDLYREGVAAEQRQNANFEFQGDVAQAIIHHEAREGNRR